MATKYVCGASNCSGLDLTQQVETAKLQQGLMVLELAGPEPENAPPPAQPRKPVFDVEVICPGCKTRQLFDVHDSNAQVQGRPLVESEAAALDKLRALFEPQKSAERLDSFATWLFGGTTFFTALVGFYTYTVHDQVKAGSQVVFTVALLLLGLSMACAARMKTPALKAFNPASPTSMLQALEERAKERSKQLAWASGFFAAALALAGAAPGLGALITPKPDARVTTSYTRDAGGKLSAVLKATAMEPGEVFGARIRRKGSPETVLVEGAQAVKADGSGDLTLEVAKLEPGAWELATYTRAGGTEKDAGVHVLTGLAAPVVAPQPSSLETAFSFSAKDAKLTLEALGSGLRPYEPVELQVRQEKQVLGWTRGAAGQDGAVKLKLELASVDVSKAPAVLTMSGLREGKLVPLFERQVPAPEKVSVDGK